MNIPDIPELKKAMETIKCNMPPENYTMVNGALKTLLSTCQLLCDVSDKLEPKKEKGHLEKLGNARIHKGVVWDNYRVQGYNQAREEDILVFTKKMMGITPEKLHKWYLEVTDKLDPASFNREAQKPYKKLTKEQKFIDEFIANAIRQEILKGGGR